MTREEGIEAIKHHLEAIESIAKELGTEDFLTLSVHGEHLSFHNGPFKGRAEENRIHVCRIKGNWHQFHLI